MVRGAGPQVIEELSGRDRASARERSP
jgi:hypothetical protein